MRYMISVFNQVLVFACTAVMGSNIFQDLTVYTVCPHYKWSSLLQSDGEPDPKLYFWDLDQDTVQFFNFESGRGEQDDYPSTLQNGDDEADDLNDQERSVIQNPSSHCMADKFHLH